MSTNWAARIKEFLQVPSDFSADDFPDAWSKPSDHVGPDDLTPLKAALFDKQQGGLYAIQSGVLIWGASRLESKTDVSALKELAVALFLLQQDNSYYRSPERRTNILEINEFEKYEAPGLYILDIFFDDRFYDGRRWPLYPHFSSLAQIVNLTRHHMGPAQRASFDPWLNGIIERMAILAPLPDTVDLPDEIPEDEKEAQRVVTMGPAIPPQALDLSRPFQDHDPREAWIEFLTTVDWPGNRFLNPPESVAPVRGRAYAEPR
jgi:hypothetical protein